MEETNVSSVNAEPVANVEPQTEQENAETVNAGEAEIATATQDKPVQSPEENAKFAAVRREAEARARDAVIAELYGESHGIKTYADYQRAIAEQQAEAERVRIYSETGIDPDALKPVFEQWKQSDPDIQELKAIRAEKNITQAITDLNNELKDAGVDLQIKDLSNEELAKIPNIDKVTELVQKGHTLADAFFLANKKDIISRQATKAQQDTIKKIAANGEASPGSLSATGEDDFISADMFEKNKSDRRWVIKNLSKITKSRAKW